MSHREDRMLIEFSVGNYRSFKERVTLSLEAADIASQPPSLDEHNAFSTGDDLRLLTSAAIYGANASGKSNLLSGLRFMRNFILGSSRETQIGAPIVVEPFRLSSATEQQPSFFELVFLLAGEQFRYGFAVNAERVVEEWLYRLGSARESILFIRTSEGVKVNARTFREGRGLEGRTRVNALFLSVVAQFNGSIAIQIIRWLETMLIPAGLTSDADRIDAALHLDGAEDGKTIVELIKRLDTGIDAIQLERMPWPANGQQPQAGELLVVKTIHKKYDADGIPVGQEALNMWNHESDGTQRLFSLAYPLLRVLRVGGILAIDELDARLHSNAVIKIIRLFNDLAANPRHAQLIFTTHNTNLLNAKLFRRDQIWFVEKSRQGASDLYSLVEYRIDGKIIRNDASFEKDYVAGRYGAVPFIGDLGALLGAEREQTAQS
jgi:uncharacterized protein